jgi:DeoR/GlpR family transcriptional regulator of sugar metabolism
VAEATIRRDLDDLAADGVLRRFHGGATLEVGSGYEPPFAVRERTNADAKRAIADAVAEQINDGDTVIVDGGSTGVAIAERLLARAVTVCPLSLRVAWTLAQSPTVSLLAPGGTIRRRELSIVGPLTIDFLRAHQFDTYVMTASGMSETNGLSEWNPDDAAVKQAAIACARTTIAAVDASKYPKTGFVKVCPISVPAAIFTDTRLSQPGRELITAAGGRLRIATR